MATLDSTVARYWNWDVSLTDSDFTPTLQPSNLIKIDTDTSTVYLLDPADTDYSGAPATFTLNPPESIRSNFKILIPLWIAWHDEKAPGGGTAHAHSKLAKEKYNLGHITSQVSVNGSSYPLDVIVSSHDNNPTHSPSAPLIEDFSSDDFSLTIPPNTHKKSIVHISDLVTWPDNRPVTVQAGSHGWWLLLPPASNPTGPGLTPTSVLHSGSNTISYGPTTVADADPSAGSHELTTKQITYTIQIQ